jgi:putative ABC transport system permease protein
MSLPGRLWRRLAFLLRRRQFERELQEEVEFHLAMNAQVNREAGMASGEAEWAAKRRFGSSARAKELSREQWGWRLLDEAGQDLKYAARMMRRSPGFTAITAGTLALGIGAATAVFSVAYGVWLAPLPYAQPDRLVDLSLQQLTGHRFESGVSHLNLLDWKAHAKSFEDLAAFQIQRLANVIGGPQPEELETYRVSVNLFPLLGIRPFLGQGFRPENDARGGPRSAVLDYEYWSTRFGADPNALGRCIEVDGESFTIIGVMPPRFQIPPHWTARWRSAMWLSLNLSPEYAASRGAHNLHVVARLKSDVPIAQARAEMDAVMARLRAGYPNENAGWGAKVSPLSESRIMDSVRPALVLLMAAVAVLLLIACANIAGMLLARAAARESEFTIRRALGVSRMRLTRQLLVESLLLACVGGAAGIGIAFCALSSLKALLPATMPRVEEIGINSAVLLTAAGCSLATGLLFGIAPALQFGRASLERGLRQESRSISQRNRGAKVLVAGEVALALLLLASGGVLGQNVYHLTNVDPGFQRENVLTMRLLVSRTRHPEGRQVEGFREELLARISALPGVLRAGTVSALPFGIISQGTNFTVAGSSEPPRTEPFATFAYVSGDYFRALGIPLLRGRYLDASDTLPVAIVSESLARRYWPNGNALGGRIRLNATESAKWFTVAGVVKDVRHFSLTKEPEPAIYILNRQVPASRQGSALSRFIVLVVRTVGDASAIARQARAVVADIDKDQPIADMTTMEQLVAREIAGPRLNMVLVGVFASLAVLLAVIGVFGIVSYTVSRRTNEIGIRVALGAHPRDVLRMVTVEAFSLAGIGLFAGAVLVFATSRLLTRFVYAVRPGDPGIVAGAAALLAAAVVVASVAPARRAVRVDPVAALRRE